MTIEHRISHYPSGLYINIFSALLLDEDSSFAQAKTPTYELNNLCVLTTAATRAHNWPVIYIQAPSTPVDSAAVRSEVVILLLMIHCLLLLPLC